MKRKFLAVLLSAVFAFSLCAFTGCGSDDSSKQAYVSLDINPAIELIVDKDGKVVSVRGENEDGQVLLYQETGIEGEDVEAAIKKITELAVKYGYLDEENKVVDTLVTSPDNDYAAKILEKVNTTVTATAANSGLTVKTDGEGAYSLLRKMEEIKKQFPNNSAVQNASVQKFKLALSVSETGEISIDAALELDDKELIETLKTANAKIEKYATEAYNEAKSKALAVYEKATELAEHAVYYSFCFKKAATNPQLAYYGAAYQAYASAAKGFDVICDAYELALKVKNYPLNEAQISAIATALGMESVEPLKNSDGEITVESIETYADKLFKNSPASEALNAQKAALTAALGQAESAIKTKINEISEEYKPQIEAAINSANAMIDAAESAFALLPTVKQQFETAIADMKTVINDITAVLDSGKIELDALKNKVKVLENKANEYLKKIEDSLTKDELAQIEKEKEEAVAKLSANKQAFEKALDDAAKIAQEYLANLKSERTAANA